MPLGATILFCSHPLLYAGWLCIPNMLLIITSTHKAVTILGTQCSYAEHRLLMYRTRFTASACPTAHTTRIHCVSLRLEYGNRQKRKNETRKSGSGKEFKGL
ncbi:hypothetical protein BBOMB_1078 [Bifidobacterium bombi DSM 19703]|uniref:Uncharacterized protein n=1 Tax=Bifidobacterium bombi DSM 19703 TaxID=1341695 RepID=A0A080N3R8_9BIFI|nr:hypothetical protein BBOMB_1078 [Bifidobacterium bombi DSM 19703]